MAKGGFLRKFFGAKFKGKTENEARRRAVKFIRLTQVRRGRKHKLL